MRSNECASEIGTTSRSCLRTWSPKLKVNDPVFQSAVAESLSDRFPLLAVDEAKGLICIVRLVWNVRAEGVGNTHVCCSCDT